jgi:CheY-like chemotaxis protein
MTADTARAQNPLLTNRRHLIVDDEPFTRQVIASAFRGLGCHKLLFSGDGIEALDKLENTGERVDFVLSDFQMPKMTGLQLLKSIRTGVRGISNKTSFGLLTGYSDRDIVGAAFRLDVDCFLTKPISIVALRERLEHCLLQDWVLTDPSHYEAVNVDLRKDMSLDVEQAPVAPSIAAKVPDGHVAATAVPLGEVKPGSMLLGDLKTSSGQLILADGQILSDRVLVLLRQLSEIDPSVGKINLSVPVT